MRSSLSMTTAPRVSSCSASDLPTSSSSTCCSETVIVAASRTRLGGTLLEQLTLPKPAVLSQPVLGEGEALFEAVGERGMEGIVAKKAGSLYYPGRRSPDWRKIAHKHRGRAVVGGFLAGEGTRTSTFGSLLLGLWAADGLRFVGSVGSGLYRQPCGRSAPFSIRSRRQGLAVRERRSMCPATSRMSIRSLVVEIEYRQWTPYDRLRAPVFKGLALDVPPDSVTWEAEGPNRQRPDSG